jgi:uncharacterized repeat protein (TIGR03803 family)
MKRQNERRRATSAMCLKATRCAAALAIVFLLPVISPNLAFAQRAGSSPFRDDASSYPVAAPAAMLTVLHSFAGGNDGASPMAGVVFDASGNLYGTTAYGGLGFGTVFKVSKAGTETVLYRFKAGADGEAPDGDLLLDSKENVYGTTFFGGAYGGGCVSESGCGTVFKVSKAGKETVLYRFKGHPDGEAAAAGLVQDNNGNLYGTTRYGGTGGQTGLGTVFKLNRAGKETVLYSFQGSPDGADPQGGRLMLDKSSNLYGTTSFGGKGGGTVFKLDQADTETILHSFTGGYDGSSPRAGLVQDRKGNLYTTTSLGGPYGIGNVVKLSKTDKFTVLYSFGEYNNHYDGIYPEASLVLDPKGNLYGTTNAGGTYDYGTVFKVDQAGKETILWSFTGGEDGNGPTADLVLDSSGNLYGTTTAGGASGNGVVFKLEQGATR